MKLGVVGPTRGGRTTLFTLLTGMEPGADALAGRNVTKVVQVPDARLDKLRDAYKPKSFKPAAFEAMDFGVGVSKEQRLGEERSADAFLVVLPAFDGVDPKRALADLEADWMLLDMQSAERRLEKIDARIKRPIPAKEKDELAAERDLMTAVHAWVGGEKPLRTMPLEPKQVEVLKAYALFTLKPMLFVVNVGEDRLPYKDGIAESLGIPQGVVVCGKLEAELAVMPPEERSVFQQEYGITQLARERVIFAAYKMLGLEAFFTAGDDEVRAWTIAKGSTAHEAAGAIHSDIQRGFIRAEVLAFDDYAACGMDMKKVKAANKLRLEGKDYIVKDGDIIEFRFSV